MRSTASCAPTRETTTTMAALAPWSRQANGTLMARGAGEWLGAGNPATTMSPLSCGDGVERVTRIELALSAWEADVLPLNYTRERPERLPGAEHLPGRPTCPDIVPDDARCRRR